ncbi:MAG: hypothetical protein ACNA8W_14960 [Bradymonadaceae bacterium]
MSRQSLLTPGMNAITEDLLNNPGKRTVLERYALTAALIPKLEGAHTNLVQVAQREGELRTRLQEIMAELASRDQTHDRMNRGIYNGLEAAADLAETPEEGQPFIAAQGDLYPERLTINSLSYLDQSGNALRIAQRATPEVRAILRQVQMGTRNLEEVLDAALENARIMGELVAEREGLSGDSDITRISANDVRQARFDWIKVINTLLSTLTLVDIPPDDHRRLLANLQAAEARATRTRPGERRGTPVEDAPVEDAPVEDVNDDVDPGPLPVADEPELGPLPVADEPVLPFVDDLI